MVPWSSYGNLIQGSGAEGYRELVYGTLIGASASEQYPEAVHWISIGDSGVERYTKSVYGTQLSIPQALVVTSACGMAGSCNFFTASHTRGDKCPSPLQFLHVILCTSLATPTSLRLETLLGFCMICTKAAFPFLFVCWPANANNVSTHYTYTQYSYGSICKTSYIYCQSLHMHSDTVLKNIFVNLSLYFLVLAEWIATSHHAVAETGHNGTSLYAFHQTSRPHQ